MRRIEVTKRELNPRDYVGRIPDEHEMGDIIDESTIVTVDGKPIMAYVILDEKDCAAMRRVALSTRIAKSSRKNGVQTQSAVKIHPTDRWVDMGANIGAFSVFAGSLGCPVVSYEAEPYNAEATRRNLERNGIQGLVTNAAIVPMDYADKTVTFYVSRRPMALRRHSIARPKKDYDIITVPAIKWRDAIPSGFDCVKMNIEGVEVDIMKRSRPEDFAGIRKLVFEWSFDKEPMVPVLRDVLAMLRQAFPYVDCNRGGLEKVEKWGFYPPNAFVYACR